MAAKFKNQNMSAKLLFLVLFISSISCFGQISFEKGYFIDNSGLRTDCLIKNYDWKNNPTEFEYKSSEKAVVRRESISSVKEFGIYDISKYVKHSVDIDRSSKVLTHMSRQKEPIFKKEQLFLKVLVEGKANLFKYTDGNLVRFFYQIENSIVDQLISKKYKTKDGEVAQNDIFQQQLLNDMRCGNVAISDFYKIDYRDNQLTDFFINYNECSNANYTVYKKKQKNDLFNITIKPGLNNSSLDIQSTVFSGRNADFGGKTGFRIGLEFEYVFPFNKNKWSIFLEPTYQKFEAKKELLDIPTITVPFDDKITINYTSIELPVGIRHYMFLNENSKLFINAALIFDFSSSKFEFQRLSDLEIKGNNNIAFGFGYEFRNKYNLEFRYTTTRDLLSTQSAWSADYNYTAIILGYTLF